MYWCWHKWEYTTIESISRPGYYKTRICTKCYKKQAIVDYQKYNIDLSMSEIRDKKLNSLIKD